MQRKIGRDRRHLIRKKIKYPEKEKGNGNEDHDTIYNSTRISKNEAFIERIHAYVLLLRFTCIDIIKEEGEEEEKKEEVKGEERKETNKQKINK